MPHVFTTLISVAELRELLADVARDRGYLRGRDAAAASEEVSS